MKNQIYVAPVIEKISVEFENGIAQSGTPAPESYGAAGAAGGGVDETGYTTW